MKAILCLSVLILCIAGSAWAAAGPEDAVRDHLAAIQAQNFVGADRYFSAAFLKAFKGDVAKLNEYYLTRQEQLKRGYQLTLNEPLNDEDLQTAVVAVEFESPYPDDPVTVTERVYYYLIQEKAPGGPGTDNRDMAWRIDIFDALRYDSLADARRRAYMNTSEAWMDQETREMRSRQGLFRIQWALEHFYEKHGRYPLRLLGESNRRDELITGGQLQGTYPACGFGDRPMRVVGVDERSSGDFSYIGIDHNGDQQMDGYWLLLHAKNERAYYYNGHDIIFILASSEAISQAELAEEFAAFWQEHSGDALELTGNAESLEPRGTLVPRSAAPDAVSSLPEGEAAQAPAEASAADSTEAAPVKSASTADPASGALPAQARLTAQGLALAAMRGGWTAQATPKPGFSLPKALEELVVRTFGWK